MHWNIFCSDCWCSGCGASRPDVCTTSQARWKNCVIVEWPSEAQCWWPRRAVVSTRPRVDCSFLWLSLCWSVSLSVCFCLFVSFTVCQFVCICLSVSLSMLYVFSHTLPVICCQSFCLLQQTKYKCVCVWFHFQVGSVHTTLHCAVLVSAKQWKLLSLPCAALCCAAVHCTVCVLHYATYWHGTTKVTVERCAALHCTVPCCTALRRAALHCAVLCCTAPCCTVPCCTVPRCTAPCCAALCHAVLHCAMLCCTAPCCTVPCCAALRRAALRRAALRRASLRRAALRHAAVDCAVLHC